MDEHMDEPVHVAEEDWAREIERIRCNRPRTLTFVASAPPGVAKKAALMVGIGLLTRNPNAGALMGSKLSDLKADIGRDVLRPDRCCLCGLNSVTKTDVLKTKVENAAGTLVGGELLGKQELFTTVGYCTPCQAQVKNLPGISLAGYAKVDGAWRLTLTFQNDRVAREYYRLNVDRVLGQIWAAAVVGDVEAVASLLDAGTTVDIRSNKGTTLLHVSAECGDTEMMDLLIERGAYVDAITPKGVTPLHMAAAYGGLGVAERLLAASAHVDPVDINGFTPFHYACEMGRGDVATALLAHGANVNAFSAIKKTPAMFAACRPDTEMMDLLIERGADVDAITTKGVTPLHMAALQGGPAVAERLLAAGAQVDPVDTNGATPLHCACEKGRGDIATVLLAHGANVNALTASKKTPAMCAASHPEIQELLRRYAEGAAVRLESESGTPAE